MAYYINSLSSADTPRDIKSLIPDAQLRRRMSVLVRSGVATAMECLGGLPDGEKVSAIIVATGLGCLADSEKFLRTVIGNGEQLLTPTPFIQSTFNTIGAQIALLTDNRGYNMTYTHGNTSFQNALLDAVMQIDEGAEHVLLGAAEESTPTLVTIKRRMGRLKKAQRGEGCHFFVVSARPLKSCVAVIRDIRFAGLGHGTPAKLTDTTGTERMVYDETTGGVYDTSEAKLLFEAVRKAVVEEHDVIITTPAYGESITEIRVGCYR